MVPVIPVHPVGVNTEGQGDWIRTLYDTNEHEFRVDACQFRINVEIEGDNGGIGLNASSGWERTHWILDTREGVYRGVPTCLLNCEWIWYTPLIDLLQCTWLRLDCWVQTVNIQCSGITWRPTGKLNIPELMSAGVERSIVHWNVDCDFFYFFLFFLF